MEDVNARKMRVYGASRDERARRANRKGALLPLPQDRFVHAEWKAARVNRRDYHVDFEGHYYSAPQAMAGEKVEARVTTTPEPQRALPRARQLRTWAQRRAQHRQEELDVDRASRPVAFVLRECARGQESAWRHQLHLRPREPRRPFAAGRVITDEAKPELISTAPPRGGSSSTPRVRGGAALGCPALLLSARGCLRARAR